MRDFIVPLIADVLRNPLINGRAFFRIAIWAFGFDHYKRDTINETDDIGAAMVDAVGAQHIEFFGKEETVVLGPVPVNKIDGGVGFFAIDKFGDGDAVEQVVVDFFVSDSQPFIERRGTDFADDIIDSFIGKGMFAPGKGEATLLQFGTQNLA